MGYKKATLWTFQLTKNEIPYKKTWTLVRKENLKSEIESLQIAAQNNAIRSNYDKARIDMTQQNSR